MKCFRCKNPIHIKDDHYRFDEFNNSKKVNTDYCHKECWNEFKQQILNIDKSREMLDGLNGALKRFGILSDKKEVYI